MKKFVMIRVHDIGGSSGTGRTLDGVQFSNGRVAVSWLATGDVPATSVVVWDNFEDFKSVHIDSHPQNKAKILWEDDPEFPID